MQYIGIPITEEEWERWSNFDESLECPELFHGRPIDVCALFNHFRQCRIFVVANLWYAVAPLFLINVLRERLAPEALFDLFSDLKRDSRDCGCIPAQISDDGMEVDIARMLTDCSIILDSYPDNSIGA